ncbi:hypothetical protein [Synechococcus sp. MIT S9451]|uniref:hypothetical protein n=1 Tax=Synechococcus sp. MIT S9451 TaxID=3082543 RepID=UPI0039B5810E
MTFSFYSKFNKSFTKKAAKFTNFSSKLTKGVSINKTKELEFDASKIHLDLNKNIQVGMTLDHSNIGTTEIKDKFDGYDKNDRNSKLMGYIGKFKNSRGHEGHEEEDLADAAVGGFCAGASWQAARNPASATFGAVIAGFCGGYFVGSVIRDAFTPEPVERGAGGAQNDETTTPASEPVNNPENDPTNEPKEDNKDEEPNESRTEDGSDEEPNECLPEDGPEGEAATQSDNPIDEGQGGNDEEAGSSFGDTDSDINWGPDGQHSGDDDSSNNGPIDQLDPITNWGPDGKDGEAQSTMSLGIGVLDPCTNWGDSQSDVYVISDFSGILGDIDPTHNDSGNDVSNLVESMTAVVSDFF